MNVVAVIPAKGTSTRVPSKNIRDMLGRPLIAWTVEAALGAKSIDRVIVSTDDENIATIAKKYGAETPFLEPKEISAGGGNMEKVMLYVVDWLEKNEDYKVDIIVLLLPTNPVRVPAQIDECVDVFKKSGVDCVATVCEVKGDRNPYRIFVRDAKGKVMTAMGRELKDMHQYSQDLPMCYVCHGTCIVLKPDNLRSNPPVLWGTTMNFYEMEEIFDADINTQEDWNVTEDKLRRLHSTVASDKTDDAL